MKLETLLGERREELATAWCEAFFQSYPIDTVGFLRKQRDQFKNPIAHRTEAAVEALMNALVSGELDMDEISEPMDEIVRVRAVQDFSPSRAVGIFFLLKSIVRKKIPETQKDPELARQMLQFDEKVDSLALVAFDIYSSCREKLFQLRVEEVKRRQSRLLQRAGMICSTEADDPSSTKH